MKNIRLITLSFLLVTSSTSIAQGIDYDILCGLQQQRTPTMSRVMEWTSNSLVLAPVVPASFLLTGYKTDNPQITQVGAATGIAFVTAFVVTEGLKFTIRRPRPYNGYPDDLIPVKRTVGYSFPSGHTSLTFSVATSLSLSCPKWYVIAPSMLWASSVAFSRLYLGVHYPSDVLTGMIVGTASGIFGYWLSKRMQEESILPAPKLMTMPIVVKF